MPKLSDYFKPDNIKNYLNGRFNKFRAEWDILPAHIMEQALYRAILCKPCYDAGKCHGCGCPTPDMFYSTTKVDSDGKWDKMLNKEDWDIFKEENEIDLAEVTMDKIKTDATLTNLIDKFLKKQDALKR